MSRKNNAKNYEEAIASLQEILKQVENNELGIDQLAEKLKEAKTLIAYCKEKLYHTDEEIRKILDSGEK